LPELNTMDGWMDGHNSVIMLASNSSRSSSCRVGRCVQDDGSKRTIRGVFRRLKRLGYDVESMWREIGRLAVKTIIAILPELKVEHEIEIANLRPDVSCFQVAYTVPIQITTLNSNVP